MFSGKILATFIAGILAFQAAYAAPAPAPDAHPVAPGLIDVPAAPVAGLSDLQPAEYACSPTRSPEYADYRYLTFNIVILTSPVPT